MTATEHIIFKIQKYENQIFHCKKYTKYQPLNRYLEYWNFDWNNKNRTVVYQPKTIVLQRKLMKLTSFMWMPENNNFLRNPCLPRK